ncbi:hypothetical protein AWZ03_004586 [Drosophila navojoa]|uniref:Uncharacterized protein n=1 Tax=Drosophila navojoa TaxID=7232 RepID=A0A484BL22_DRONA|nr:uncharacterized protein LOC108652654 [Drosophila navojoa]TDG48902.1 hypothetical protein AWZ03_004586 [Drosophila navojoa]
MRATRIMPLFPLLLPLLLLLVVRSRAETPDAAHLQQIPQLSHEQLALIAGNATARCQLVPQLCDWQLHLYEGHAFQVSLPENGPQPDEQQPGEAPTQQLLFTVPSAEHEQMLLIYAQVERQAKPSLKPKNKSKSKSGKRKRRLMSTN